MTNINRPRRHTSAPTRTADRRNRSDRRYTHRPSDQLITDAVVATYIHDISARHARPGRFGDPHRIEGDAA